jgi:alpha-glucosidase (family GH31 glycosyl hydrolase)
MTRVLGSIALVVLTASFSVADDKQNDSSAKAGKHCFHATISKLDAQHDKLTVKCCDKSGQSQEKSLQLSSDVAFKDSSGKTAKRDDFQAGDDVVITEKDGKVTEIKENDEATITKVDPQAGTVTLKTKDDNGKETEKTFKLVEDAEYIDSSGRVAKLDIFRSGDQVLVIEGEGHIQSMKKSDGSKSSDTTANSANKSSSSSSNKK